jgi:hypothetical protein
MKNTSFALTNLVNPNLFHGNSKIGENLHQPTNSKVMRKIRKFKKLVSLRKLD